MEGCGAKTVLLSLTGQSRASAVENVGRARVLRRQERGDETARVAGAQTDEKCDGERYIEGWKMSQSRMTTRLRSRAYVRLEFSRMELCLSVALHSAMRDKWQDGGEVARGSPVCTKSLCSRRKTVIK